MANFKYKKTNRAGCKMCKPWKRPGCKEKSFSEVRSIQDSIEEGIEEYYEDDWDFFGYRHFYDYSYSRY